jgi:hypothetical protein
MYTKNLKPDVKAVFVPKENKHDDTLYIAVNGKRMMIKKGITVSLPAEFAEVVENSFSSRQSADEFINSVSGR